MIKLTIEQFQQRIEINFDDKGQTADIRAVDFQTGASSMYNRDAVSVMAAVDLVMARNGGRRFEAETYQLADTAMPSDPALRWAP